MSAASADRRPRSSARYRIRLSVGVAIGVVLAYMVLVNGLQVTSGTAYADWFANSGNAFRNGVIPLLAGSVLLIAFVAWSRWDMLWRDAARLPMSKLLWAPAVLFAIAIVVRLSGIEWAAVPGKLLLAVTLTSVLVGFAEETLFRGIFLRGLRTNRRPEGTAALWTSIAFGLFHLPNIFLGQGALGLLQVVLAAITGAVLYLIRRGFSSIVPAMIAHGLWDFSVFLDGEYGRGFPHSISLPLTLAVAMLAMIAIITVFRRDRAITMTPAGLQTVAAVSAR
jgi:membrane protease YdiL (CAAX protease family)